MRLAVTFDFLEYIDIRREGIGAYARYLLNALLYYDKDIEIEFWTYDFNIENLHNLFSDIITKYKSRISIIAIKNTMLPDKSKLILYLPFLITYNLKFIVYKILTIINKNKYSNKLNTLKALGTNLLYNYQIQSLIQKIKKDSRADAVYIMFPTLKTGKYFTCAKFMQVHDLFTLRFKNIFLSFWNNEVLNEYNNNIVKNLSEYAIKNTTFISSSEYTTREHCLKCIPNIKQNQTAVIPFPPLCKEFNEIKCISKEEFKAKFGIWKLYIAIPSQNRPNKNWQVIFKAIARLKQKGINIQFVTTGKVNDLKYDEQLVKKLGISENILEVGRLSDQDLYMLYKYQDVSVGSSLMEGMGISGQVIEALKINNIPAVHTKSYGIKESLEAVGLTMENADLNWFDPNDDKALANIIENILANPTPHIEKQRHIIEAYSSVTWENVTEKYIALFNSKIL